MTKKAVSVNPFAFYGLPTLLYGTLLPAPDTVKGLEHVLRRVLDEGHELGVHGYDHVEWHDRLFQKGERFMKEQLEKATESYRRVARSSPDGFAAPGWQMTGECSTELKKLGYTYSSSTRGATPFIPECGDEPGIAEIPTTLPTLDELTLVVGSDQKKILAYFGDRLRSDALNVHTIHAELEGSSAVDLLMGIIGLLKERGARYTRLKDACAVSGALKKGSIAQRSIEGRPGTVACQI